MQKPDHNNSAAFILTHGRPDRVHTYNLLRRSGWTRPIYLIVDDEDKRADEYLGKYGEEVIIFSKEEIGKRFDIADTQPNRNTVTFARNASFDIAEDLGLDYHMQLDDDYVHFEYRYKEENKLKTVNILQFDRVFDELATFLDLSGAKSVALAQGGDMIGGLNGGFFRQRLKRKAMNSFICRSDRRFTFIGRMNDDVNTYVVLGQRGDLFFTVADVDLVQTATQSQSGGLTEMYQASGTYTKSFYTVMMAPSSVTVSAMSTAHARIHHRISWDNTAPKILSDKHRKT